MIFHTQICVYKRLVGMGKVVGVDMRHFFRRKSSCQVAKDRLKILLISDRVNCSPEMMELIKTDIAKVISKYMKIDSENMEIQINTKGSKSGRAAKPSLCANIPIVDVTMPELKSQEALKM